MNTPIEDIRQLAAFVHLLKRFRDEEASIYNALAMGYDRFADQWDRSFARPALDFLFLEMGKRLPENPRILDAGCGTGRHLPEVILRFDPQTLTGIDCSPRMLDMARRRFGASAVNWVLGDLSSLPFPDNSFDAVIGIWVIEAMSDPAQAVREFLRVLRPGGVVGYTFVHIPPQIDRVETRLQSATRADAKNGATSGDTPLSPMPFHHCERSSLRHFRDGLITVATLGKCCSVEDSILPNSRALPIDLSIASNP